MIFFYPIQRTFYVIVTIVLTSLSASGQSMTIQELVSLSNHTSSKLPVVISKKGYTLQYGESNADSSVFRAIKKSKKNKTQRTLIAYKASDVQQFRYTTDSKEEHLSLNKYLVSSGFKYSPSLSNITPVLYQKGRVTVAYRQIPGDSTTQYQYQVAVNDLPKAKDLTYAEDLLQLSSQEYLVTVFGAGSIKKDLFYLSETEAIPCTVLFPKSNREIVFLWKDPVNFTGISAIRFGGNPQTESSMKHDEVVEALLLHETS